MSTIIETIEKRQLRRVPRFDAGDRVRVHFQVVEGTRRRTQVFEGVVIKRQGSGARETFTVRKQSFGVGVERTFPVHSPKIERLEVAGRGDVRRAKLYYLRGRVGKRARVAERRWGIDEELIVGPEPAEETATGEGGSEAGEAAPDAPEGGAEAEAAEPERDAGADQPHADADEASTGEPQADADEPPGDEPQDSAAEAPADEPHDSADEPPPADEPQAEPESEVAQPEAESEAEGETETEAEEAPDAGSDKDEG